jgi:RNA polymerase sigma-70 factor, ECF subfamily
LGVVECLPILFTPASHSTIPGLFSVGISICAHTGVLPRVIRMLFKPNGSSSGPDMLVEHIDGLYSYAVALTRNRSDAEDLVQETYVRAIPAIGRLRQDSNIKSWLFTILRNIWLNQLRQPRTALQVPKSDIDQYVADVPAGDLKDPHSLLMSKIDQEQVRQAIQQLPVEAREIILLREFEELSYQEIADVLGCPIGTVMSRLGRARAKLRVLLSTAVQTASVPTGQTLK